MDVRRFPTTILLFASVLLAFAVELRLGAMGDENKLVWLGAIRDAGTLRGEYWRVLTYAWLHASFFHVAMNATLLWWLCRMVERRLGSGRTLGVYLVGVVGGGIAIATKAALYPKVGASVGASAGVSALLACALVLLHRPASAVFGQPRRIRIALWSILITGLAASLLPGVSLVGHLAGVFLGALGGLPVPVRAPVPRGAAKVV